MGQQQLLLITVAIIIVGIAFLVSFSIYRENAIEQNRDSVTNQSLSLAALAMTYYKKPKGAGENNKTFIGWVVPSDLTNTASGTFDAQVYRR